MTGRKYKTAIIGCGRVAWLLDNDPLIPEKPCSHAGAYHADERIEISAAADINQDRLLAFSEQYGVNRTYTDKHQRQKGCRTSACRKRL